MSLLLNNPEAMKQALAEIETCIGKDRMLYETNLSKLNYMNNIIKETLRPYPPIPLLLPHTSVRDCFVFGYEVLKAPWY